MAIFIFLFFIFDRRYYIFKQIKFSLCEVEARVGYIIWCQNIIQIIFGFIWNNNSKILARDLYITYCIF